MSRFGHRLTHPRPVLALAVAMVALAGLAPGAGAQEECEVPLFVKQNSAGANVMILADNSGSMNEVIFHDDYDPSVVYVGFFNPSSTYVVTKTKVLAPIAFNAGWPAAPSATLVESDNGEDGRYPGNYLNWIYCQSTPGVYHITPEQRAAIPPYTRIQVLKSVMNAIIDYSPKLRMGITVFDGDKGGNIVGQIGKSHNALQSIINGITANSWTPLAEALEDVVDYFMGDLPSSPIQYGCEYNFTIVITDGYPTHDLNVSPRYRDADGDGNEPGSCTSIGAPYSDWLDCSDYFDDVAYWAAHNDLHPLPGDQIMYTYVVGYGLDAPLLEEAAANGDGLYFTADNAVELFRSIEYALQDILRRISSGSAVAVVSTEAGADDRLYRGKFMPVDWNGYLECFELPYADGDLPLWEAGSQLERRNPNTRNIFTAVEDREYSFTGANANTLRNKLGAGTEAEAVDLINWGRGEFVPGLRDRNGRVLGDIVSATPVVVGPPAGFHATEEFQSYYQSHKERPRHVYVGANDGMLHAFDAETGEETWAFVPEFALPIFSVMADSGYCHRYSCDQTVTVKDLQLGGIWRTVLAAGGGNGGATVFALDITDPYHPEVLWQYDLPNGARGHPKVSLTAIGDTPVALVGSGLVEDVKAEAFLYAIDLETGTLLGERLLSMTSGRNRCSQPEVVDLDLDGRSDLVYMADLAGSIWRLKPGDNPDPATWTVSELYAGSQEITADPVAALGESGDVYVYFGTGAYIDDPDLLSTDQNYFVCAFDSHSGTTADLGDMANQTSSLNSVDGAAGWYYVLSHEGERVTQRAVVVAKEAIFSAFSPSGDACSAGGESWLYQMRYDNGGVAGDDEGDDDLADRETSLGGGIASYPVVDLGSGEVVVQSSDASISVEAISTPYLRLIVRSWQENYDHVQPVAQGATEGDAQAGGN